MAVFELNPAVTDELLAEARSYLGMELRYEQWNHEASRDAIRHYAWGIGDDNPLWCDPSHALEGPYGDLVAPPTFLYTVSCTTCCPGLSGLQALYAGADWRFYRPVRRGEALSYRARAVGARDVVGATGSRMILQTGQVDFYGAGGDKVGTAVASTWRTARASAEGGLRYEARERHVTTPEEWREIEAGVRAEICRGADTRYWDDVSLGEALTPVVKGPLDQTTMTAFYAGQIGSAGAKACELRWKNWIAASESPGSLPNYVDASYFGERVLPSMGHQDDSVARELGMPGAYDNGQQRVSWLAHAVTNWMSDRGWLEALNVRVLRPNMFGDTAWIRGTVTGKHVDEFDRRRTVDVKLESRNQLGELNASGSAVVVLPSRIGG